MTSNPNFWHHSLSFVTPSTLLFPRHSSSMRSETASGVAPTLPRGREGCKRPLRPAMVNLTSRHFNLKVKCFLQDITCTALCYLLIMPCGISEHSQMVCVQRLLCCSEAVPVLIRRRFARLWHSTTAQIGNADTVIAPEKARSRYGAGGCTGM